jgi:hypothetical protein
MARHNVSLNLSNQRCAHILFLLFDGCGDWAKPVDDIASIGDVLQMKIVAGCSGFIIVT